MNTHYRCEVCGCPVDQPVEDPIYKILLDGSPDPLGRKLLIDRVGMIVCGRCFLSDFAASELEKSTKSKPKA